MEKQLKFGFKSRRPKKEEEVMKFNFPYIEVVPSKGKGSVTKFRLLNGAAELLKLDSKDNKVSYFQLEGDDDNFFLANTSNLDANPAEARINADRSFNNKSLHKRICEDWKLDLTEVLTFSVLEIEVPGYEELTTVQIEQLEPAIITPSDENNKVADDEPKFIPIDPESVIESEMPNV